MDLASLAGLGGLTIGALAEHTGLSKSGLFAHFGSKATLQIETLKAAAERFLAAVVRPALSEPRGEPRVRALFERWLAWSSTAGAPGGCVFVAASVELDDREGPVRDYLVEAQAGWFDIIARTARLGVESGNFRADLDVRLFAHELQSLFLGYHFARRLLRHPDAEARARAAFERLLRDARRS